MIKISLSVFIIIVFQLLGTTLITYINLNLINLKGQSNLQVQKISYYFVDFSLSMFICISYGRQMLGGFQIQPNRFLEFLEEMIVIHLKQNNIYNYSNDRRLMDALPVDIQMKYFIAQIAQYSIEKKMTFIQQNRYLYLYLYLPLIFMIARTYRRNSNGVNPAYGLGFELIYCITSQKWDVMEMSYILILGAFCEALIGVFIFDYCFRKLFRVKVQQYELKYGDDNKIDVLKRNEIDRWNLIQQHQRIQMLKEMNQLSIKMMMKQIVQE